MATEGDGLQSGQAEQVMSDSERPPEYGNGRNSGDVNLVVNGGDNHNNNNNGYQTSETVVMDTKERRYNGVLAQFGMRTRSINVGSQENLDVNGYFLERVDTENYDVDMTPWVGCENDYLLGLHTTKFINIKSKSCECNSNSNKAVGVEFGNTVLHHKNSQRLVIKQRNQVGVLEQAKRQILIVACALFFILSVAFLASDIGGLIAIGVIFLFLTFYLLYLVLKSTTGEGNTYSFTTQSIPLNSIFWVNRKLSIVEETPCCRVECMCPEQNDIERKFSDVTIGFNRNVTSNTFAYGGGGSFSTNFNGLTGKDSGTLDVISIKLENNQAYNLQHYLDCIITGCNAMQYNHIDSKFIYHKILP